MMQPEPVQNALHPASVPPDQLLSECDVRFMRRSGPGGQNRNKVETAVILTHRPTGIRAEANEQRSQEQNKKVAVSRLRVNLALEVRCPVDRVAEPSALWRSRCQGGRIRVNPNHEDFPTLLAEALNVVADREMDLKAATDVLGCSTSQLIKLLKVEPRALKWVNDERKTRGLHPFV